jgi:MSHA pilin protein MshB
MKKERGFTLIELIIVIVILGILSVIAFPRFSNLQVDANAALVSGVGGAFRDAVGLAHLKWQIDNGVGPVDNLDLYGTGANTMDMNTNGWPAQSYIPFEANPQLNNTNDCMSVFRAILSDDSPGVSTTNTETFQVTYSANTCTFALVEQPEFSIFYDSNTGQIDIDVVL